MHISLILILALALGACSSTYKAGVTGYDDLYYTPGDARMQAAAQESASSTVPEKKAGTQDLSDYEKYRLALEQGDTADAAQIGESQYVMEDTSYYPARGCDP